MAIATDAALVTAVAAGDGDALAELCRRYERPLYAFLTRHTGGRDADDLYQETWLRVVRAASRFDPTRRFSTWLFQIALNLARDQRRRARPELGEEHDVAGSAAAEREEPRRDAAIDARSLLARLPEAQRSVVLLRLCQDLGEDEVATILDCPRGTVKSRLHHALRRLRELVAEGQGD